MSYDLVRDKIIVNKKILQLSKQRSICQKVVETLKTDGWKEIIEPIIDKHIIDVLGGKIGDTWVSGKLCKAKTDEKREYYIGYKQALIDLVGRIKFHVKEYQRLEDEIKSLSIEVEQGYRMPMEDTRYGSKA
jgi:hypothetical protein